MRDWILENLGVKPVGVAATGADAALCTKALEGFFYEKRGRLKAPFAITSWPEWVQQPTVDIVSFRLANAFGVPSEMYQRLRDAWKLSKRRLDAQLDGDTADVPTESDYF